jgi:hypothetical protein
MGSFVGLVEINETFPVPLAGLSAKDKSSPIGLPCPMGFSPRLNSTPFSEDIV